MHLEPAGDERTSELIVPPPEPTPLTVAKPERPDRSDRNARPTLVLRPQVHWRVAGPALIVFALLLLAAGRLRAAPFAFIFFVVGVGFLPALWERVDVSADTISHHGFRKRQSVSLTEIDAFRLRRIAFPALKFIHRGYKVGRYWSIPLTLRLLHRDEPLLELRCGWWNGWRELSRYVIVSCPDVDLDGRTRGRLERYVGVALPPIDKP